MTHKKCILTGIVMVVLLILMSGCTTTSSKDSSYSAPLSKYGNPDSYQVNGKNYHVLKSARGYCKTGYASWYGTKFHGRKTSSREPYDMYAMTAASQTLPIPTYVEVVNLENGKSVTVRVNDRGPFRSDRIIDLSYGAATKLGFANKGTALVRVTAVEGGSSYAMKEAELVEPAPSALPEPQEHYQQLHRYLQVGAFTHRENADHLSEEISQLISAPVHVNATLKEDQYIYRVQIGPFQDANESDTIQENLIAHGVGKFITVFS